MCNESVSQICGGSGSDLGWIWTGFGSDLVGFMSDLGQIDGGSVGFCWVPGFCWIRLDSVGFGWVLSVVTLPHDG